VSLVYLSTASASLHFSSRSSSRASVFPSLSLSLSLSASPPFSRPPAPIQPVHSRGRALVALFACLSRAADCGRVSGRADAVHLFVTASPATPQGRYRRQRSGHVPREEIRDRFEIMRVPRNSGGLETEVARSLRAKFVDYTASSGGD
jgi:hypothetical protein